MNPTVRAVIEVLQAELEAVERRALQAAEGATHEESRPEDPKDTRGLETSYLAHGLARRAADLRRDIDTLRFLDARPFSSATPIAAGAMVRLEDERGKENTLIILPCAGGTEVTCDGQRVRVVTPQSPLGAALLEKREGDDIQVRIAGTPREWVIVSVG